MIALHPNAVEFDEMECCAMQRASTQEIHRALIKKLMALHNEDVFLGIFKYTVHLVFIPSNMHSTLYMSLAAAEKASFEKPEDERLECGHLATEHWKALDEVCHKMMRSQQPNYWPKK
ncbi:MAG: hypothetical protein Q8R40_02340 [bacterium]|nr:hypothetical protein [bacterium]